jgi:hypothetical protein
MKKCVCIASYNQLECLKCLRQNGYKSVCGRLGCLKYLHENTGNSIIIDVKTKGQIEYLKYLQEHTVLVNKK